MKERGRVGRLIWQYFRAHGRAALLYLTLCAVFVLLHVLGMGKMEELGYALLLSGLILLAAFWISFVRFASQQYALWRALEQLPPDPEGLPQAHGPIQEGYRELAQAYGREQQRLRDELVRADRDRTDYYTLWVHQIKTPIAALQLMAQSELPPDRELLRQEIFKIEQYAEAALSYQRLCSMQNDLELDWVPLYPLCRRVVTRLRPLFSYRKIRLEMRPFEGRVLTDAKWLETVLTQVLSNSLKYTPEGGAITVEQADEGVLTLADNGIGIRPEDVPRVFDRGFTGHIGRLHEKSTGIGLYLSKEICALLGHGISLVSAPGQGTCVTLDLRRSETEVF